MNGFAARSNRRLARLDETIYQIEGVFFPMANAKNLGPYSMVSVGFRYEYRDSKNILVFALIFPFALGDLSFRFGSLLVAKNGALDRSVGGPNPS